MQTNLLSVFLLIGRYRNPFPIIITFMALLACYHSCCQQSQKAHTAFSLRVIQQPLFHPIQPTFASPQKTGTQIFQRGSFISKVNEEATVSAAESPGRSAFNYLNPGSLPVPAGLCLLHLKKSSGEVSSSKPWYTAYCTLLYEVYFTLSTHWSTATPLL